MTSDSKMIVGMGMGASTGASMLDDMMRNKPSEFKPRSIMYGRMVTQQKQKEKQRVVKHNRKLAKAARKARKAQRKATMGMRK